MEIARCGQPLTAVDGDHLAGEIFRMLRHQEGGEIAEFRVLAAFLDRPQRVLSRDQLIEAGKGVDSDVFDRAIDVTISRLRKKLGPDDPIRTIRNEGYMFTLKVEGE